MFENYPKLQMVDGVSECWRWSPSQWFNVRSRTKCKARKCFVYASGTTKLSIFNSNRLLSGVNGIAFKLG